METQTAERKRSRDPRCGPAGRLGRTSTLRPLDSPLLWRLGHPRVAAGGWRPLTGPRADHGRPRSSIPDPASRAPVETGDALCAAPRRAAAAGVVVGSPRSHAPTAMPTQHARHQQPSPQPQPRAGSRVLFHVRLSLQLFDRPCPLARAMHRRQAPFVVFFTYTCFLRVSYYATSGRDIGRSHSRLIPTGAGSCDQWSRVALPSRRTSREGSELGRGACCESAARPRACAASCSGGARALKALWSWR